MHRRQYIPGSHIKVNRTRLAEQHKALREQHTNSVMTSAERIRSLASERDALFQRTFRQRLRRFTEWLKHLFRRPIQVPKAA